MKLIVVGSGGNGQTYFMRFLIRNGFQVNHLWHRDGIKHCRHPKLIENRDITHSIFLYNDPYLSIKLEGGIKIILKNGLLILIITKPSLDVSVILEN